MGDKEKEPCKEVDFDEEEQDNDEKENDDHGWQMTKEKWSEQILYLLENSKWTDCTFIVGLDPEHTKKFKCHKVLLAKSSPVFEKMLFGSMASKEIELPDKPEVFEALLHFLYTGMLDVRLYSVVLGLCLAADKYMLFPLKSRCLEHLYKAMEPWTACGAFELAKLMEFKTLRQKAWRIIVERTDEVLRVFSFREASRVTVLCIVQMHTLHLECETQLIAACSRWAEHRALMGEVSDNTEGLRQALGPVFQHLRFLTLTAEEFADGVAKLRILSPEEKVALYGVLIQKSFDGLPPGFSTMAGKRKTLQLKPPTFTFTPEINNFYSSANAGANATNTKLCYKCKRAKSPPPAGVVCSVTFTVDSEIRMLGMAFPKETDLMKPRVHVQNSRGVTQDFGTYSVAVTNAILLMFQKPVHVPRGETMHVMVAQDSGECRLMNFRSSIGHNVFSERSLAANPNASCITGVFYKRA